MIRYALLPLCACGWIFGLPATSSAQRIAIWGGEYERALRPGVYIPYDGAPFSHRYNYEVGPLLYFGVDSRQLIYLEYLDRVDRAQRFGYPIPPNPFDPVPRRNIIFYR
jgi:hypothetical protein